TNTAAGSTWRARLPPKVSPSIFSRRGGPSGPFSASSGLSPQWGIGRHLCGPVAGLIALILLATCPLYYGHMFINAKDAPFAAAMAVLLLGMVRVFEEYPRPNARTVALTGVGLGLVFGSRILAGIIAPYALAALLLIAVGEARSAGFRQSAARVGEFIRRIVPALALGYLIMGLLWPWSILSPLNPVRAAEYFDKFFEKPWRELYAGKIISVTAMPADYLPRLVALKLPEIMLVLGLAGVAGALFAATRRQLPLNRRASFVLVALAAILPVLVAIVAHPAFYNGLRHFVFVVPPFAAIGGLAGAWLFEWAHAFGKLATAALAAIFVGAVALPVSDMVRLHPYQYTAFNWA